MHPSAYYYPYTIPSSQPGVTLEREQVEETTSEYCEYCELVGSLSLISLMVVYSIEVIEEVIS